MTGQVEDKRVLEDVLDEVLSFNYRSVRTLRDIFIRPGRIAAAFAAGDRETYTPTMRVWFCVISWLFLLSVIWGGFGELIMRSSNASGGALEPFIVDGRRDLDAVLGAVSSMSALLYVPISSVFILIGVNVLRMFNKSLTFIQTVQCYFVPITAMATVSTLMLVASTIEPRMLFVAPLFNYAVFIGTATPVIHAVFSSSLVGTVLKTAALTIVVALLTTLSTLITFVLGIFYALMTVPPNF
jgi:hypothetical protein